MIKSRNEIIRILGDIEIIKDLKNYLLALQDWQGQVTSTNSVSNNYLINLLNNNIILNCINNEYKIFFENKN